MLQKETVERETFELLETLMHDEKLNDFILAGGTALALCLGHRKSIDLDLFSFVSFDGKALQKHLIENYAFITDDAREHNTVKGYINDIKIDLIAHIYPLLNDPIVSEGIRIYSLNDIAAMKLAAISDNGTRLKDFIDIACLSTKMSLSEMLSSYIKKYEKTNPFHAIKGLSYFEEINFNVNIDFINVSSDWRKIERRIIDMIKYEDKVFATAPLS